MTLETSTATCCLPSLAKGSSDAGVLVQRGGAGRRREVVGLKPVLPDHDGIGGHAANVLDELREMPGDLGIGPGVVRRCRRDRLRLAAEYAGGVHWSLEEIPQRRSRWLNDEPAL
jgi:hypothetical protein